MKKLLLPDLIGITGKKRHGKNTVALMLAGPTNVWAFAAKVTDVSVCLDAFAEPIKEIAQRYFGLTREQTHGEKKEVIDPRWNLTPREIMQRIGTEMGRSIHPDVWMRLALARHAVRPRVSTTIITDVRFKNEVAALKDVGGIILGVRRHGIEDNQFSDHASEQEIEEILKYHCDHVFINDGHLRELHAAVSAYVEGWKRA